MKKTILFLLVIVGSAISAKAQLGDSVKVYLIRDFTRAKAYTQEYLNTMPAKKYGFRAQDSIRTFAQQMLHLADANFGIAGLATGAPVPRPAGYERTGNTSKDSVVTAVNASYDFIIEAIRKTDPSGFLTEAKMGNIGFSKLAWFNKAFEHQTHHRGQTTVYIRAAGLKPPPERLF
jgi:uncharacterized damage-inducible protein DinB